VLFVQLTVLGGDEVVGFHGMPSGFSVLSSCGCNAVLNVNT
jgi:hypothetical protein